MKRASAASDDVEAELDHRFGGADDIVRRRGPVYNSRECIATRHDDLDKLRSAVRGYRRCACVPEASQ